MDKILSILIIIALFISFNYNNDYNNIEYIEKANATEIKKEQKELRKNINDILLDDRPLIIACINQNTLEIKNVSENGDCLIWRNFQNIMLPPKSHMSKWTDVFENQQQILNRLPIVNFESWFDPYASNSIARWYIQTLKEYNISTDITAQLEWLKTRQNSQYNGNCSQWVEHGEERLLRCLYARHLGVLNWYHWYPNKLIVVRNFYLDYFEKNNLYIKM